jgi:hypothetical protein
MNGTGVQRADKRLAVKSSAERVRIFRARRRAEGRRLISVYVPEQTLEQIRELLRRTNVRRKPG